MPLKTTIFSKISNPSDFIVTPVEQNIQIIIKSDKQWQVITIPRDISLMLAIEIAKAEAGQMKRDIGGEVRPVILFEKVSGL